MVCGETENCWMHSEVKKHFHKSLTTVVILMVMNLLLLQRRVFEDTRTRDALTSQQHSHLSSSKMRRYQAALVFTAMLEDLMKLVRNQTEAKIWFWNLSEANFATGGREGEQLHRWIQSLIPSRGEFVSKSGNNMMTLWRYILYVATHVKIYVSQLYDRRFLRKQSLSPQSTRPLGLSRIWLTCIRIPPTRCSCSTQSKFTTVLSIADEHVGSDVGQPYDWFFSVCFP